MEGLLWAEETCKNFSVKEVENQVFGSSDEFDIGAKAYLIHRITLAKTGLLLVDNDSHLEVS
jgi:hypothetical protein